LDKLYQIKTLIKFCRFVRKVKEKKNTEWRDCIADYVLEVRNDLKQIHT
jgi:hypothetical protein